MIEIREAEQFTDWFSELKDRLLAHELMCELGGCLLEIRVWSKQLAMV
jgi:hypothetical protein